MTIDALLHHVIQGLIDPAPGSDRTAVGIILPDREGSKP